MNAHNVFALPGNASKGVEYGAIVSVNEQGYIVQGSSGILFARPAFSCLVKPLINDRVMYTHDPIGGVFILSILERYENQKTTLSCQGDLVVQSTNGRLVLSGETEVDLKANSVVRLCSREINVDATNSDINISNIKASSESFEGALTKINIISNTVEIVAERVTERFKNSYRWIAQLEHTTAGQMIHRVHNLFSIRAKHSTITAKNDVKIDGERVHLG